MTELTRQIKSASMSHSLMNGFSLILPRLAEENDARIKQLELENAKLREELNITVRVAVSNLVSSIRREVPLEEENTKLRELVKHLYVCRRHAEVECDDFHCELCDYDNDDQECDFERRSIELGIEVS